MRALVTGATGFIGRQLIQRLNEGAPVVVTRRPEHARKMLGKDIAIHHWDPQTSFPPAALENVDVVFNLMGESVAEGRWTEKKKNRIRVSRVEGTRKLVEAIQKSSNRPRVLVSASAIGYYGQGGAEILEETAPSGSDFLSEVCSGWESAAQQASQLGVRVVNPRIGVVLGPGGGPLQKMLPPFKFGMGGPLGSGNQWMSWIHHDDMINLLLHLAREEDISGPVNAVSPVPVTNREFTKTLGRLLKRPVLLVVPAPVLRLMLGELADQLLLISQRVVPTVAQQKKFEFQYPNLQTALEQILKKPHPREA